MREGQGTFRYVKGVGAAFGGLLLLATTTQAAFIVEPRSSGKAFANFSANGTPSTSTASATAVGLTAGLGSIFGGTNATQDIYTYSYTPGTNADNTTFSSGDALGNGNTATGITGGGSATYNVYACWPNTNNISDNGATPTNFVATSDSTAVNVGINEDEDTNGSIVGGVWVLLGSVDLTAGNTYTITQTAPNSSFVSMRAAGVMWERVTPIPEPATAGALGFGALALAGLRRRR